jgi:hypothetical protein
MARGNEAYALWLLGEIHAHQDPLAAETAEATYRQALALAEELGMRPLLAHCHLGLGTLYTKIGHLAQARAALSTAIELFHTMEMPFWLLRAKAVLAQAQLTREYDCSLPSRLGHHSDLRPSRFLRSKCRLKLGTRATRQRSSCSHSAQPSRPSAS